MAVQSGFCSENFVTLSSMAALTSELEIQKQEIDYLLHFQKEKVRNAIRHVEREGWRVIRAKEGDLAEAIRRGRAVEERVRKVEVEKERWKRMANEKGDMVMGLQRKLEEARERQIMVSNGGEDAESHYPLQEEEEEKSGGSGRGRSALGCKSCKKRNLCVLFLPCRHLCSCKYCEAFLGCCPVCHSVKEASVEVLFL